MTEMYARMPDAPQNAVRLRVDVDGLEIAAPVKRRWWQFWRPKVSMQKLAEMTYPIHPNDRVSLMQAGAGYIATVNDALVLRRWPGEARRGWGVGYSNEESGGV